MRVKQSQLLFDNIGTFSTMDVLAEHIELYAGERIDPDEIPLSRDRWVLSSNLQKTIRLGLAETAIGTAQALIKIDEPYFWRRLLVIAYEDVGVGNFAALYNVLRLFRRTALHRRFGSMTVAMFLIKQLCWAAKSRSLCDALVAMEWSPHWHDLEEQLSELPVDSVLDLACDRNAAPMQRVAATRRLAGYSVFTDGAYRTIHRPSRPHLTVLCRNLCLTEVETRLFLSGQNVTESMNVALPVCIDMVRHGGTCVVRNDRTFLIHNGILTAALDRHTRLGKQALGIFARESTELRDLLNDCKLTDQISALGAALFIVEGSMLDKQLNFSGSAELTAVANDAFLAHCGVGGETGHELVRLVADSLSNLHHIRWGMLA